MDGEAGRLVESLRAGAGRLVQDLAALERGMGELYDAASARAAPSGGGEATTTADRHGAPASQPGARRPTAEAAQPESPSAAVGEAPATGESPAAPAAAAVAEGTSAGGGDLDGARLIALNMALNGQSREDADRYLAAHFESIDRLKLIDEVYAAIEG
jgi:hypothetical protein